MNASPRRRAVILVEMMILLLLFMLISGAALWAFRMNMDVHRRTGEQAARQAVMDAILNALRGDMRQANAVRVTAGAPSSAPADDADEDDARLSPDEPGEAEVCSVVVQTAAG